MGSRQSGNLTEETQKNDGTWAEAIHADALTLRASAKLQEGHFAEAIADFDKALESKSRDARSALRRRDGPKFRQRDVATPIANLGKALQKNRGCADILRMRGDAKLQQGDLAGAIADFDRALELKSTDADNLKMRGSRQFQRGNSTGSDLDNRALELKPEDANVLTLRGNAKLQQLDLAGAIVDLSRALELNPEEADALTLRGKAKLQQGDLAGAIADRDMVRQLCPNYIGSDDVDGGWIENKVDGLESLQDCRMSEQVKWAIIGAGPVGLTLALSLAESMDERGLDPDDVQIDIYESHWIQWSKPLKGGNSRRARDQVVTLQDPVVQSLSREVQTAFEGEKVWLHSRNVPVAEIENRLLMKARQQTPYNKYIHIHQCDPLPDEEQQAAWIQTLDAQFVVAADGAGSLSRRAFPDAFINPTATGANRSAQQIRLGETSPDFDEADYSLGIALKPEKRPQAQALNVILTLAQNVYLLNSQQGSRGFLNIRITKEEYDEVLRATGNKVCAVGPIRLFEEEDLHFITGEERSEIQVRLPWLKRRIEEGLKLFGMQLEHMQFVTGFQMRPSYAQTFFHVLPRKDAISPSPPKVLLLAGDAAISHHLWLGRGLNTGLKSAVGIVEMWCNTATVREGLRKYNVFMDRLRRREMQGRSASMMRREMRLPCQMTTGGSRYDEILSCVAMLLPPKPSEAQQWSKLAREQEQTNRLKFLKHCKMWRDFLQRSQGWPHDRVTDEDLEERIFNRVSRPKELELHLMVSSAFDNGEGRAAGWPTSKQGGAEVDPKDEEHWR